MPRAFVCLLALSLAAVSASAQPAGGVPSNLLGQPPRDVRPASGHAAIRGRVVAADTGQPLRRAEVRVSAADQRIGRGTLTGADGRYEFPDLPAGRYSIHVNKTTFIAWSYGQTRPGGTGTPVVLADNQAADNIDIRLFRGAVIAGRITDEVGDPVPNARVTLMRAQFRRGERTLAASTTATTNDIGEYRIFGLSPGQYFVSAMFQQQGMMADPGRDPLEGREARNGYAPTFYPGTASTGSAQKLTVGLGHTLSEINISLLAARTATISGTAVDSQGRPISGIVQIRPRGGTSGLGSFGGMIRPDGTFSIPNIWPGEYALLVNGPRGPQGPPGTPGASPEFALAYVTVNGDDVTGVSLASVTPVSITGRVSFDDQDSSQPVKASAVRVLTLAAIVGDAGLGIGSGGNPLPVNDDFTFAMKTTPGRMAILATAKGWQVKAIRVNGRDVTDIELDVGSQGLSGVDIEMTNRLQEVSGAVKDASGTPVANAVVLIFAQDRSRWTASWGRYEERSRADADGRFKASTLPPGEYYAIAVDHTDTIEGQDPDLLEGLIRYASAFSLAPGDRRTLDLKLFTVE